MLYNPPVGASSNAAYVGKDLVAGTQGSKVPRMAVEAPQREIVAAIIAAGLVPTNDNLAQLAEAIPILSAKFDTIVTPVTKTVGGAGADFVDLRAAFAWVSRYRIAYGGSVNFVHAAGAFVYTITPLVLYHPDGQNIYITGAPMQGAIPTYTTFQVTGPSPSQRSADYAVNLAAVRGRYGTELTFTAGANLDNRSNVNLTNLLVVSDGSNATRDGLVNRMGYQSLNNIAVAGAGNRGIVSANGGLTTANVFAIGGGGAGIVAEDGGHMAFAGTTLAIGCGSAGFVALVASGMRAVGGSARAAGCGGAGFAAQEGGVISFPTPGTATANHNSGSGFLAVDKGRLSAPGSSSLYNGGAGYYAQNGSSMDATNTTGAGNVTGGITANVLSHVTATGSTATPLSPAANTVGNSNSTIYV